MPGYRVYCLDSKGVVALADWIETETDEQAIAEARRLRPDAHKCEIWLKNRLVAKLNEVGRFERVDA